MLDGLIPLEISKHTTSSISTAKNFIILGANIENRSQRNIGGSASQRVYPHRASAQPEPRSSHSSSRGFKESRCRAKDELNSFSNQNGQMEHVMVQALSLLTQQHIARKRVCQEGSTI